MFKKVLIGAVAVALTSGTAYAGETSSRRKRVAVCSGARRLARSSAARSALIRSDDRRHRRRQHRHGEARREEAVVRADQLQQELVDTRIALAKASRRTGGDEMLDALAARLHADVMFRTGTSELDVDVQKKIADLGQMLAGTRNWKSSCTASPTRAANPRRTWSCR